MIKDLGAQVEVHTIEAIARIAVAKALSAAKASDNKGGRPSRAEEIRVAYANVPEEKLLAPVGKSDQALYRYLHVIIEKKTKNPKGPALMRCAQP